MVVDFELNDEQKELQKLARDFAKKEILPVAEEHDRDSKFPLEIAQKALEVGLMNPGFPEYVGGIDLDFRRMYHRRRAWRSLYWYCDSFRANMLATAPLIVVDDKDINKKFMAPMMEELVRFTVLLNQQQDQM